MLKGRLSLVNSLPPPGDPFHEALAHLHDHRRHHNSADELLRRNFHGLQHSLNSRDLELHHHKHIDNLVGVQSLWELGVLGHLVDRDFQSTTKSELEGPAAAAPQAYRQPCRCSKSAGSRDAWSPG